MHRRRTNTKDPVQPIIPKKCREHLVIDLVDLGKFIAENDEYRYILTIIDSFSKRTWTEALKSKTARM